jgi:tocopherol cyclase
MLPRLKRIWRPEQFHYHHRLAAPGRRSVFEGWYFKIVDGKERRPYAIIPGVFLGADSHAFIQVLDGARGVGHYIRFDLAEFHAERDRFDLRIGDNRFNEFGLELNIQSNGIAAVGRIEFGAWSKWPVRTLSPGAMGPYAFTPFMQCYHGMLSMRHELSGALTIDGRETRYDGGLGYCEKDWGRGFPAGYVWMQSLHFDTPGVSVSASVARIPFLGGGFRGFLAGFLHNGRLYRFTTYTGAKIESFSVTDAEVALVIVDRRHRLKLRAWRTKRGGILHAPYEQRMLERVAEVMTSRISLEFARATDGQILFAGEGRMACLEAVNPEAIR